MRANWLKNRFYAGFFWIAALIILIAPAQQLRFNNDDWLPETHQQEIHLDYLADQFSPGDGLVIALPLEGGFFDYAALRRLSRLESALRNHLGKDLISMRSPLSATRLADNKGIIEIESFAAAFHRGAFKNLSDYQKGFTESPYAGRLLSKDHKIAAIDLRLDTREQADRRARVISVIRTVLAHEGWRGQYHLTAQAALKDTINAATRADLPRLIMAAALVLAVFLILTLGRISSSVLILLMAVLAILGSLSMIVLIGHQMTVIASILPIMAGVISVAHGLHILAQHKHLRQDASSAGDNAAIIAQKTMMRVWRPCFFANLTTAIGFGSFAVSGLLPLQNFGWDSLVVMTMLYLLVLSSFWSLLYFFERWVGLHQGARFYHFSYFFERCLRLCHHLTTRHAAKICLATGLLTLFLAAGLLRSHTETNFLSVFFKPDSQIRKDFALADEKLGGSGAMDVILRHKKPDRFKELDAFNAAHHLGQKFAAHDKVNYAEAMDIPVGLAHRAFGGKKSLPGSNNQLAQELLFLELSRSEAKDDILSPYANFDYTATRIHLRTPDLGSSAINRLISDIADSAKSGEQAGEVILTGFNVFIHTLGRLILTTQIESLALAGLFVLIVFVALFGFHIGLLGFAANLVPVLAVLGVIAWSGAPFDFTTILVASITLGLAVDDSIHFLYSWRHARRGGRTAAEARAHALHITGWAIILTSFLFCAGFAVFFVSDLILLENFAIFMIAGLSLDLFASILFLPALLAFAGPHDIDSAV